MTMHSKTIKFIWAKFSNTTGMMKTRILMKCMVISCYFFFIVQPNPSPSPSVPYCGHTKFHQIGVLDFLNSSTESPKSGALMTCR